MHSRIAPLLISLSILGLSACAAKDESAKPADTAAKQAGNPTSPNIVTYHAKDFAFDGPAEIPAGMTTFKLMNDGPAFHHMVIVRLDSGKTAADFQTALPEAIKKHLPPPAWAVTLGGPNGPNPGAESNTTLDIAAGNYLLLCFVDIPDGVMHAAKGMVRPLTVTASTGAAAVAPVADITVSLKEYGFELSKAVTAGSHTFEVRNAGKQDHEVEVIKLAPGKTFDDFAKWAMKPEGPPPASALGGTVLGLTGVPSYFTADFTPGNYVFVCFIPDPKDGKPHFVHGMMHSFTVN